MGHVVEAICATNPALEIVAGFDILGGPRDFPVFSHPLECKLAADVVIDFSSPAALSSLLSFCTLRGIPVVLATTGYSDAQVEQIEAASKTIPIFRSANMSLGISLLLDLAKRAASVLGEHYDIEIVERHHNRKVDAPSGTALMLADGIREVLPFQPAYVYDRQCVRRPREKNEIGISAIRGGTIAGDHQIIFAGWDEVIELSHHAASREVFANGAIQAAKFLVGKPAGCYDMSALLADVPMGEAFCSAND